MKTKELLEMRPMLAELAKLAMPIGVSRQILRWEVLARDQAEWMREHMEKLCAEFHAEDLGKGTIQFTTEADRAGFEQLYNSAMDANVPNLPPMIDLRKESASLRLSAAALEQLEQIAMLEEGDHETAENEVQ